MESSNTFGILKILRVVKKIVVPDACGLKDNEESIGIATTEDKNEQQTSQLQLTIPEIRVESDWSGSPKKQRLSNMILGSKNTSRENLDEEKDKEVGGEGPIIYNQNDGLEDPGSPCSITPFIMPSCSQHKTSRVSMVVRTF